MLMTCVIVALHCVMSTNGIFLYDILRHSNKVTMNRVVVLLPLSVSEVYIVVWLQKIVNHASLCRS